MAGVAEESNSMLGHPILNRVYLVCFLHLILCIFIIAATPGHNDAMVGGLQIEGKWQWANTTFSLISIMCIIHAGIGTLFAVESHLNVYYFLLLASLLVDSAWLMAFIASGLKSVSIDLALCVIIAFKAVAINAVSKSSMLVRNRYNADLLPHLKFALSRSVANGVRSTDAGPRGPPPEVSPFFEKKPPSPTSTLPPASRDETQFLPVGSGKPSLTLPLPSSRVSATKAQSMPVPSNIATMMMSTSPTNNKRPPSPQSRTFVKTIM
jgi:hypothetical protein